MARYYTLDGREPKPIDNVVDWAIWFEAANRQVAETQLPNNVSVSTVFLGLDHSMGGDIPILFETMIFGGKHDNHQDRYATWEEAERGHLLAIKLALEK